MTQKEHTIIALPTKGESKIIYNTIHKVYGYGDMADIPTQPKYHLYLLSDDEIKKDDWIYNKIQNQIFQRDSDLLNPTIAKKIIATTDTSLNKGDILVRHIITEGENAGLISQYPNLSQSFIEEWVKNPIDKVMVDYEEMLQLQSSANYLGVGKDKLFINLDNTINCYIKSEPIMYSEEEVLTLIKTFREVLVDCIGNKGLIGANDWFEQNKKK